MIPFGPAGDQAIAVPGDYDGKGQTDLAVYEPATGLFMYQPSSGGPAVSLTVGPGNGLGIPAPGDYLGDGYTDFAVYVPSLGQLIYDEATGGPPATLQLEKPGSQALPAAVDLDADEYSEPALYDSGTAEFLTLPEYSLSGTINKQSLGVGSGEVPATMILTSPNPWAPAATTAPPSNQGTPPNPVGGTSANPSAPIFLGETAHHRFHGQEKQEEADRVRPALQRRGEYGFRNQPVALLGFSDPEARSEQSAATARRRQLGGAGLVNVGRGPPARNAEEEPGHQPTGVRPHQRRRHGDRSGVDHTLNDFA